MTKETQYLTEDEIDSSDFINYELLKQFNADKVMYQLKYAYQRYLSEKRGGQEELAMKFSAVVQHLINKLDNLILGGLIK